MLANYREENEARVMMREKVALEGRERCSFPFNFSKNEFSKSNILKTIYLNYELFSLLSSSR
jgi:hypothetical protein